MAAPASSSTPPAPRLAVIVCAHDEAAFIAPCLHSLLAQTRVPDAVVVVDNASRDATAAIAAAVPGVQVVSEPVKGLVRARERGRLATDAELLLFVAADCRAPLQWISGSSGASAPAPICWRCPAPFASTTGTGSGGSSSAATTSPSARPPICWSNTS